MGSILNQLEVKLVYNMSCSRNYIGVGRTRSGSRSRRLLPIVGEHIEMPAAGESKEIGRGRSKSVRGRRELV